MNNEPLSIEEIAELERLEKAATLDPWIINKYTNYEGFSIYGSEGFGCVAERWEDPKNTNDQRKEMRGNNASLIVTMRNALPRLLAQARRAAELEDELASSMCEAEDYLDSWRSQEEETKIAQAELDRARALIGKLLKFAGHDLGCRSLMTDNGSCSCGYDSLREEAREICNEEVETKG